jgi:Tetratricopeptide repeat
LPLTGLAGLTGLAVQVLGRRSADDADVVFVALEQVRSPRTLASALASQLQVHDQPSMPLIESLQAALSAGTRKLLLLDGAPRLADQVAELGEVCWTVPPLGCPAAAAEAADITGSDAVRLFIARARERLPDFRASEVAPQAIAELGRRLDGLPLAIELIAGWVGTLSVREILQQRAVLLDSVPAQRGQPGQHGGRRLADVLQVSYDLLTGEQQRRLAMLSVLAGSFRIADVQAVLDVDAPTAIATTRALVDSSWLNALGGRERRHRPRPARQLGAMALVAVQRPARPTAISATTRAPGEASSGRWNSARSLPTGGACRWRSTIWPYWSLTMATPTAQRLFEQALVIKREFGEQRSIALGLANLADVLIRTGQWDAAETVLAEGAGLAAGNPQLVGTIACNQGALAAHRQDCALATERFEAAIAASQAGGHPHDVIEALIGLGRVHDQAGDHQSAVARVRAARALATEIGTRSCLRRRRLPSRRSPVLVQAPLSSPSRPPCHPGRPGRRT